MAYRQDIYDEMFKILAVREKGRNRSVKPGIDENEVFALFDAGSIAFDAHRRGDRAAMRAAAMDAVVTGLFLLFSLDDALI